MSTLSNDFSSKVLAATKDGAFVTTDKSALAGLSDSQFARGRNRRRKRASRTVIVLPLQNTTQQPELADAQPSRHPQEHCSRIVESRRTRRCQRHARHASRIWPSCARSAAQLLGFPNHAAWKLQDQMAKTPGSRAEIPGCAGAGRHRKAASEAKDIQDLIDAQKGGFTLAPWDWNFYSEQVRKAKYDLNDAEVKPYFELNNVLENGVFYAANQLYGITFKERKDIPVYQPDVRVFEVSNSDGKPLALFYCDYFKRDNKNGGAWMSNFVDQSKLLGTLAGGLQRRELLEARARRASAHQLHDVTTMFHEFGHALHGHVREHRVSEASRAHPRRGISWSSLRNSTSIGRFIHRVRALRQALQDRRADACGVGREGRERRGRSTRGTS